MSSPAISVIVPARNSGSLLQQCIDSIRRQSFADFELILVDSIVCARDVDGLRLGLRGGAS